MLFARGLAVATCFVTPESMKRSGCTAVPRLMTLKPAFSSMMVTILAVADAEVVEPGFADRDDR